MTSWPDVVNGIFELSGACFVWLSVDKLRRDRQVRGVDWRTTAFWTLWGAWNLLYYPSLSQWASFAGGVAVVVLNAWYLALLLRYWTTSTLTTALPHTYHEGDVLQLAPLGSVQHEVVRVLSEHEVLVRQVGWPWR